MNQQLQRHIFLLAATLILSFQTQASAAPSALSNAAMNQIEHEDYAGAVKTANQALSANAKDANAYFARARAHAYLRKYQNSLSDYNSAISMGLADAPVIARRGMTYLELKRFDDANSDVELALRMDPNSAYAHFARGHLLLRKGERLSNRIHPTEAQKALYTEAVSEFSYSLKRTPHECSDYLNRGVAYKNLEQYDLADSDVNAADKVTKNLPRAKSDVHALRGNLFNCRKDTKRAAESFRLAVKCDPENEWAWSELGWDLNEQGLYSDALQALSEAIDIDPADGWAHARAGFAYLRLGRNSECITASTMSITLEPSQTPAYTNRAYAFYNIGEYSKCAQDCRHLLSVNPNDGEAVDLLLHADAHATRWLDAMSDFGSYLLLTGAVEGTAWFSVGFLLTLFVLKHNDGWTLISFG